MTHRARLLAAIARKPVDYVPCAPFFNPLTAAQRFGRRWEFPFGPSEEEMARYCSQELGVEPAVALPIGDYQPNFFMSLYYRPDPRVSSKVWAEKDEIHKVWTTPAGELHAAVKYDAQWPHGFDVPFFSDFTIGHFTTPWLESEADLECLRHTLRPLDGKEELDRVRFECGKYQAIAQELQLATIAHIGMGLTGAMQLCGSEQLCLLMMEQPDLIKGYLELEHRMNLRHMEIACDVGADIVRRNGFYETCDYYSPAMLEEFLGPLLREEIDAVHAAGKLIGYTVNTGVMPMLDYLARLDFDCLLHIDMAAEGVDLSQIRDKLAGPKSASRNCVRWPSKAVDPAFSTALEGHRTAEVDPPPDFGTRSKSLWMGPSSVYHMWADDSDVPRNALRELFDVFGKEGLIITPSPSVHSIMPWNNFLAMVDEWKQLR